jgi:hypothetical protein
MRDPGHASGNQTYPPVTPDCICGHAEMMHKLYAGERRRCGVTDSRGRCQCMFYVPKEAD